MSGNMKGAHGSAAGKTGAKPPADLDCMRSIEVAQRLGISHVTVLRLMRSRKLPGVKVGRSWVVRTADLENYLSELTRKIAEQRGLSSMDLEE